MVSQIIQVISYHVLYNTDHKIHQCKLGKVYILNKSIALNYRFKMMASLLLYLINYSNS